MTRQPPLTIAFLCALCASVATQPAWAQVKWEKNAEAAARSAAQNEIAQLRDEIDRIGKTTAFGNQHLLDGSFGAQEANIHQVLTGLASGLTLDSTSGGTSFQLVLDAGSSNGSLSVSIVITTDVTYATAASL